MLHVTMIRYAVLDLCLILLLTHIYGHSLFSINDICLKSSVEKSRSNFTFLSSFPQGGLKAIKHTLYNNTDESACYRICCYNKRCNAALSLHMICIVLECDWDKWDKCVPRVVKKDKFKLAKYFILRAPVTENITPGVNITKRTEKGSTTTTVPTTIAMPKIRVLQLDISKNQTLILPVNYVTLVANVHDDKTSKYEYQWKLLSKPADKNSGKLDTTKTKELKLTDLIAGEYEFQVEVLGNNSYGKANVFVTVKLAKKPNQPPVARIEPKNQTVQLPNNVILDGSKSTDDDKIVSFYWELIKGPLEADKNIKNEQSMLNLQHLTAGNYTFKLTVKDATGAASSDMALLTLLPEKDYPPQADPGNNIIVELPVKYVILNGSGSRDDKKIVSYQWTKKSDGLTADIQGVRAAVLNLTNLQEGTYTFNLKVTDSSGQSNDKDVQVFVKPRTNSHPTAKASVTNDKVVTVRLPATEAVLNGSLSNDDDKITQYQWQQILGQPKLNLVDADKPIAYVDDLKIGVFQFKLTVYDKEKLSNSDVVTLRINESKNQKPRVKILTSPQYYHLETNLVKIDGSKSWDDIKIVQYKWTREDDSLAVGQVLEDSDSSSILMLTDLLPGRYKFKLQVFDVEGMFDSGQTTLEIKKSKYEKNLVELQFICPLASFTELKKNAFISNLKLIIQKKLSSDNGKVVIHLMQLDKVAFKNSVVIVFYVTLNKATLSSPINTKSPTRHERSIAASVNHDIIEEVFIDALTVVETLNIIRHNSMSLEYQVMRVETYVCQNNCSNHGQCNEITKLCVCETFWTSSFVRERFGDGRPNCDWSIIYLTIFVAVLTFSLLITCWFCIWIQQRRCRTRKSPKIRKPKYTKINDYECEERLISNTKGPKSFFNGTKSRIHSDSLLHSDNTLSSEEEETAFTNTTNKTPTTTTTTQRHDHSSLNKVSSLTIIPTSNGTGPKTL